jgi:hypothetical protein
MPTKHIGAREVDCRGRGLLAAQLGELRRVVRIDVVAEDRDRLCKPRRLRRESTQTNRNGTPPGPRRELS